ncbi:phosphoserine transaminase [Methylocella silvestris]|uniref:phosphoserine transaminase n=1 Tax=Methylocella silvestris TaxID=199596 RepID=A0A2J7TJX8_METSI|nr:phosphoserine transaminase [Methylocella silvestris]PNG27071.1 phosphoserine transaminase [Methylocella silvestris]
MQTTIPALKPARPYFSCGPASKRPGWSFEALSGYAAGRSHRSAGNRAKLRRAIDLTREVLEVPATHRIAIIPGGDTGAVEAAMWSLLGQRPVEAIAWEAFSEHWAIDLIEQLRLPNARARVADYGEIIDLATVDFDNDVIFAWNGTTSGVCVQNADLIPADRKGLTICDATSAAFAQRLDWDKLDVVTYSWQKVLGGEASHGMLILGPRAAERLETFTPSWPIPKLFRLAEKQRILEAVFEGETINTPSMLCVEDYLDGLAWAQSIGGVDALIARVDANARAMSDWVARTPWIEFLASDPAIRSTTATCLKFTDPAITSGGIQAEAAFAAEVVNFLDAEGVAFDVNAYRDAPPGLRIWCGATVDTADLVALTQWIDYAYARAKATVFAEAA